MDTNDSLPTTPSPDPAPAPEATPAKSVQRRRRFIIEQKRRIVEDALASGESFSVAARHHCAKGTDHDLKIVVCPLFPMITAPTLRLSGEHWCWRESYRRFSTAETESIRYCDFGVITLH